MNIAIDRFLAIDYQKFYDLDLESKTATFVVEERERTSIGSPNSYSQRIDLVEYIIFNSISMALNFW